MFVGVFLLNVPIFMGYASRDTFEEQIKKEGQFRVE